MIVFYLLGCVISSVIGYIFLDYLKIEDRSHLMYIYLGVMFILSWLILSYIGIYFLGMGIKLAYDYISVKAWQLKNKLKGWL